MPYGDALKNYQRTNVETADIGKLVIMCYAAAIQDLEEARQLHLSQKMDPAFTKIRHAQDIITELLVGLDYERGGIIAQNLARLYNFSLRQLMGINSRGNMNAYDSVIHILAELKDAYEQIRDKAPTLTSSPTGHNWGVSA